MSKEAGDGKQKDVLIDDFTLGAGGFITVWADEGMLDVIQSISGVRQVTVRETEYHVWIDPRHDIEWLMREIEAQVKINMK